MIVKGRGPSARALREKLADIPGTLNWSGSVLRGEDVINAATTTHKLDQLQRLRSSDLPCIPFSTDPVDGWFRRSNYHAGGRDFRTDARGIRDADFYTHPIKSTAEYRVHVFRMPGSERGFPGGYRVVRIGWKIKPDAPTPLPPFPIRSRRYGWKLRYYAIPDNIRNPELKTLSKWAVAVLGWDFGCVDVLKSDDGLRILEVNSCPGLRDEITLNTYVKGIEALAMEE
jgi:hypothetical protein